jgi:hypothetical protein
MPYRAAIDYCVAVLCPFIVTLRIGADRRDPAG